MTPDEIRTEVVERLARAEYMKDREMIPDMLGMTAPPPVWEEAPEAARQEHRRFVQHLVDALGDLLPTQLEIERGLWAETFDGRTYRLEPDRYRYTTSWRDATDSTGPTGIDLTKKD